MFSRFFQSESGEITQMKSYVNKLLPPNKQVDNIATDFCDGTRLILMVESFIGSEIPKKYSTPTQRIHKIANVNLALTNMTEKLHIKVTCSSEDIVDGNLKMIMGTLWSIVRHRALTDAASKTFVQDLRHAKYARYAPEASDSKKETTSRTEDDKSTDEGETLDHDVNEAVATVDDEDEVDNTDSTYSAHSDEKDAPLDNKEDEEALRRLQEQEKERIEEAKRILAEELERHRLEELEAEERRRQAEERRLVEEQLKALEEEKERREQEERIRLEEEQRAKEEEERRRAEEEELTRRIEEERLKQEEGERLKKLLEQQELEKKKREEEEAERKKKEEEERIRREAEEEKRRIQEQELLEKLARLKEEEERKKREDEERFRREEEEKVKREEEERVKREEEEKKKTEEASTVKVVGFEVKEETIKEHAAEMASATTLSKEDEERIKAEQEFQAKSEEINRKQEEDKKKQEEKKRLSQQLAKEESAPKSAPSSPHIVPSRYKPSVSSSPSSSTLASSGSYSSIHRRQSAYLDGMGMGMAAIRIIKIKNDPFLLFTNPQTGKLVNYKIALEATNIGRKKGDNELEINSKYISRFHGRLDLKKNETNGTDEIWFKDLGSSSGSRINGKPVAEQKLRRGDQLIVGKTVLIFLDKSDAPLFPNAYRETLGWKQSTAFHKSWQIRYMVTEGHVIYYWKTQKERKDNKVPAGLIDLDNCEIEKDDEKTITLKYGKKVVNIKFPAKEEKEVWLARIQRITSRR